MYDVAAERGVLGGVFAHGEEIYADIADIVTSNTFSLDSNRIIWKIMDSICKEQPGAVLDYPTFMSAARGLGLAATFDKPSERDHLRAVMNSGQVMKRENVRKLAARIRKLEIARLLDAQLETARSNLSGVTGDEPIDRIISMAEGSIFDFSSLLSGHTEGVKLMGDGAEEYAAYLMDNPREMMGISTGMSQFDFALGGGLRTNSVDIIAARPKSGKSFLADNVSLHVADKVGVPVFNLDTEMSLEEHQHRILAHLSGVRIHDIETGRCGKNSLSRQQVLEAARRLRDMPYYYECIIGKEFEEVLASMRRWVTRTVGLGDNGKAKPCVIVYDYLKLVSANFLSNDLKEYQALGFIATALKNFMGRYGVPCLAFAQLNRDGIDREETDVLSGSDRIAHYCTSVTLYKRKSDEERAEATGDAARYTHKLVPLIFRHGEGLKSGDYINIQADYARGRIIEGPTRDQLLRNSNGPASNQGIIDHEPPDNSIGLND